MPHPFATAWEAFQIALIVWVICIVCTVVPAHFRPGQAATVRPVVVVQKDEARWLPPCPRIRKLIEQYGQSTVESEARRRGYSEDDIKRALSCLKEKKA